jgi:hypothetical protein
MYSKQEMEGLSLWERVLNRVKLTIYQMMHELLQSNSLSPFFFKILLFIEHMQFLYFSIHPRFNHFLWTIPLYHYLQTFAQYFQFNSLLELRSLTVSYALLYTCLSIQLLMGIVFGVACYFSNKRAVRASSAMASYSIKILSGFAILVSTILPLPFFNVFLDVIYCQPHHPACYAGASLAHLVMAVIGLFTLLVYCLLFCFLFADLNPDSKLPLAAPQSKASLFKLLLKVIIAIYTVLDYSGDAGEAFIVIFCILYVCHLFLHYRLIPFYNRSVRQFTLGLETVVIWVTLCAFVQAFINNNSDDEIGFYFVLIGIPLQVLFVDILVEKRMRKFL